MRISRSSGKDLGDPAYSNAGGVSAEAATPLICIPALSESGIVAMALGLLIGGTIVLGRRRAAGVTSIETA